jgi:hypothetical protein
MTRYVVERKGQLFVCEDDIRFPIERRRRMTRLDTDEIERRFPGLIAQSITDGLVPARFSLSRVP